MLDRIDAFREVLKERVCGICFDRKDDGTCGIPDGRTCAIEAHLPDIVRAVEAVESFDLAPYVDSIRARVCPNCSQDEHGRCAFRESFDCSLDSFLLLAVEVIEDVKGRMQREALSV